MLSVAEAVSRILDHAPRGSLEEISLGLACGRVLAKAVQSDVDSPPHDKSIVDGFAVRCADLHQGVGELRVIEQVVAGAVPTLAVGPGEATRIMTGAPVPMGADGVVMFERTTALPADGDVVRVRIDDSHFTPGQNIVRRATVMRAGETILSPGTKLRAIEIGLLAEVGCSQVLVARRPSIAILATGNELAPCDESPRPGQIRNSNGPLLDCAIQAAGGMTLDLGIAGDEPQQLESAIADGLDCNLLVVSGGVSAGDLDLIPATLRDMGVEEVFHKVNLKPGKPLWFGVRRSERTTLVFGLPGNPVSALVCCLLFVRPAIRRLLGLEECESQLRPARLVAPFRQRGSRPYYAPALLAWGHDGPEVTPLASRGSGDLRALAAANALAHFPAGDRDCTVDEMIDVLPLDGLV